VTCLLTAAGGDAEDVALGLVTGLLKKAGVQRDCSWIMLDSL